MTIVRYTELKSFEEQIQKRRPPCSGQGYAMWSRYDKAVRTVIRFYGKVGWGDDVDFYHGGDCFHELYDSFALRTTLALSALSPVALRDFQAVVSRHHHDAIISFGGEMGTPMDGLEVIITSSGAYAAWKGSSPTVCGRKLKKLGVEVD